MAQLACQVVGQTGWAAGVTLLQAVVHWEGQAETLDPSWWLEEESVVIGMILPDTAPGRAQ